MLYKKIGLFLIIGFIFLGSFQFAHAAEDCRLRADISVKEYKAITGKDAPEGVEFTANDNPTLKLDGSDDDVRTAGDNALLCAFGLIKWASTILLALISIVAAIMIMLAAFFFITAGQNIQRSAKARSFIAYAVLGLIVAGLAAVIPTIALSILGV